MGVQLNIKDPATVQLARELADRTGRSVTETIRAALEREHVVREEELAVRLSRIREIGAQVARKMPEDLHGLTAKEAMDTL